MDEAALVADRTVPTVVARKTMEVMTKSTGASSGCWDALDTPIVLLVTLSSSRRLDV